MPSGSRCRSGSAGHLDRARTVCRPAICRAAHDPHPSHAVGGLAILSRLGSVDSQALSPGQPRLGSSRRSLADIRISLAMVTAIVLVGSWLLLAPRSPDFAAQTYRATLFERFGFTVWDNN